MVRSFAYNEDCIKGMKQFSDKFFDLAIVDPPYGINESAHRAQSRTKLAATRCHSTSTWDHAIPPPRYFKELFRVSKNQIIWGGNYFIKHLRNTRCMIVWDKMTTADFADCEIAWTSFNSSVRKFTFMWNGMQQGKSMTEGHTMQADKSKNEIRIHETQKPIALYQWLLTNYAKKGNKILDTHLGSGSHRIASYKMGFDFWSFEKDKGHFNNQEKRFKSAISSPLFGELFQDPVPQQKSIF